MNTVLAITWNSTTQRLELTEQPDTLLTKLTTAIAISLFTDARVSDDELPEGMQNQGFWGDMFLSSSMGSKLWLLKRSTLIQDTLNNARDYITQALQWLITDGDLLAINVTIERQGTDRLGYLIQCQLASGAWETIRLEQSYGA